jgi:hypothetical protein
MTTRSRRRMDIREDEAPAECPATSPLGESLVLPFEHRSSIHATAIRIGWSFQYVSDRQSHSAGPKRKLRSQIGLIQS